MADKLKLTSAGAERLRKALIRHDMLDELQRAEHRLSDILESVTNRVAERAEEADVPRDKASYSEAVKLMSKAETLIREAENG